MGRPRKLRLSTKQAAAWQYLTDLKYRIIEDVGYGGAAGGGKSFLGCTWLITMSLKHPNTRYAAATYDITKSIDSIGVSMREALKAMNLVKDKDYFYNKKEHTYVFTKTQSEIVLFGLKYRPDDPQSAWLGGYLFTSSWVDESDRVDSRVLAVFKTRNGRYGNSVWVEYDEMSRQEKRDYPRAKENGGYAKNVIPKKVLQTFNPSQNHVFTTFWIPYKNRSQTTSRFIRATVHDNKHLDSSYVDSLKNITDEVLRQRLYEGSFEYNTSEKALFNSQSVAWMISNKIDVKPGSERFIVVDVSSSGKDQDKTIISYWHGLDCFNIEAFKHDYPEELIDKLIREKLKMGITNENIIVDANGVGSEVARSKRLKGCISFIAHNSPIKQESGTVNVFKKNKNKRSTRMFSQYHTLKDQCLWRLSEKVNNRELTASFEHEGMKQEVQQELLLIENETQGTDERRRATSKKKIKSKIGRSPDVSDVFLMRMYPEIMNEGIKKSVPLSQRKFIKKQDTNIYEHI